MRVPWNGCRPKDSETATIYIQVLSEQEMQAVHEASMAILRDTGVLISHGEVIGLLAEAGAQVD
jgi:trimethylamine:corrinoid methyltransferase-like protein